ncbi:MAG: (S)-ureidoglycine aminohydrolase [Bryobacteraceae bacterium]
MHNLGQTRSSVKRDHLLQTPDTFVRTVLPGMERATAVVHAGPALGAHFTQYTAEIEADGRLGDCGMQRLVYVLEGSIEVLDQGGLTAGAYAYLHEGSSTDLRAESASRLAVIEKPYEKLEDTEAPESFMAREEDSPSNFLGDDPALEVRTLLPAGVKYDFAVNTMTYQPGASLSMVEIHVMEHGLLMLEGGGIYRLGDSWYPVTAGDFIWMAPYCPQWFGALGKMPAKYLIYKDWNRR